MSEHKKKIEVLKMLQELKALSVKLNKPVEQILKEISES